MSPSRILYLEANEDGSVGGSHQQLYDLVKYLDREEFEPVVLFYQDNAYRQRLEEIDCEVHLFDAIRAEERSVHLTAGRLRKTLEVLRAVLRRRRFLKEHAIDLVHVNNAPSIGNDDWLPACRILGIPIVSSAMGDARGKGDPVHKLLFRSFDMVLPVSHYIENGMRDAGVPESRITTVHHGIDFQELRSRVGRKVADVRSELGVGPDQVLAAMVGNVREWKGQHVVIEGLGMLPADVRDRIQVVFAGVVRDVDQDFFRELRQRVRELELDDVVDFLGFRNDVPDIFNAADVAIHSSVVPEPGGIVVLEALCLGAAVIAADRGGHTEAIHPGNGRLFSTDHPGELADRLTELVRDPELRESLVRQAQEDIQAFSIERHTREVSKVYRRVL